MHLTYAQIQLLQIHNALNHISSAVATILDLRAMGFSDDEIRKAFYVQSR